MECTKGVYALAKGHGTVGKGTPTNGWLKFHLDDATYRKLTATPGLSAIIVVDCATSEIMSVRLVKNSSL